MALEIRLTGTAHRYFERLDKTVQERIQKKLKAIAEEPRNPVHSKALTNSEKRSARVGDYRILLSLTETEVIIADIGPRGQVYRNLSK